MYEQKIYFGAPGTGKSHLIQKKLEQVQDSKIFRVTIHPEYTYSDFVGQLLPDSAPDGGVSFSFHQGPFTDALAEAYSDGEKQVYLVLEELSRGNVSAIFGDIFQLLDRDSHFVSKYPVRNRNIADRILELTTDEVMLPSNFNILCTVNMNDQNVFPMDTAFKRRFEWEYVSTRPAVDPESGERLAGLNNPKLYVAVDADRNNDLETTWQSFYMALNRFITDKREGLGRSEDKQVGQFFLDFGEQLTKNSHSANEEEAKAARERIDAMIRNKLLLYLWQDVQGNLAFSSGRAQLFDASVGSYDELYDRYGRDRVFGESFVLGFLRQGLRAYPYVGA
ncbi:MAG: AAA family ATPase [Candidatus Gastranaerophilales bacterium]|nr:AAA family ATPase [Candidatus Gastranaerophilales bacterium]